MRHSLILSLVAATIALSACSKQTLPTIPTLTAPIASKAQDGTSIFDFKQANGGSMNLTLNYKTAQQAQAAQRKVQAFNQEVAYYTIKLSTEDSSYNVSNSYPAFTAPAAYGGSTPLQLVNLAPGYYKVEIHALDANYKDLTETEAYEDVYVTEAQVATAKNPLQVLLLDTDISLGGGGIAANMTTKDGAPNPYANYNPIMVMDSEPGYPLDLSKVYSDNDHKYGPNPMVISDQALANTDGKTFRLFKTDLYGKYDQTDSTYPNKDYMTAQFKLYPAGVNGLKYLAGTFGEGASAKSFVLYFYSDGNGHDKLVAAGPMGSPYAFTLDPEFVDSEKWYGANDDTTTVPANRYYFSGYPFSLNSTGYPDPVYNQAETNIYIDTDSSTSGHGLLGINLPDPDDTTHLLEIQQIFYNQNTPDSHN